MSKAEPSPPAAVREGTTRNSKAVLEGAEETLFVRASRRLAPWDPNSLWHSSPLSLLPNLEERLVEFGLSLILSHEEAGGSIQVQEYLWIDIYAQVVERGDNCFG